MKKQKFIVLMVVILALVMGTAVVYAAGTPAWWDNTGGPYSSWNRVIVTGNAANDSGNSQSLFIFNDNTTCINGTTRQLWTQISWVNTGSPAVTLRTNRDIEWTEDITGCPATVNDDLPSIDGAGVLTNQLAFTPTDSSVPSNLPFTDGYERSFTWPDTLATCARTTTAFNIPDGGGLEYQIEIQSVCLSPTAVSLQSFSADNSNNPVVFGVVGFMALIVVGFVALVLRREQKKA